MAGLDELLALKDAYRGRRGFVIATGPSLAYKDLSFLGNEVTIALNLAPLMCDQWGFSPTFHMVGDRYVYPRFSPIFEQLTKGAETRKIVVAAACETFPAQLADERTYFVPQMLPQDVVRFATNPVEDGFWRGKTVTYFALQFAYFLGFDEVYVLGMDMTINHDWGSDAHCYELRRHPRFPDLEFPQTETPYVQRGWPGHAEVRHSIREFLIEARRTFEAAGRRVVNDTRSAMDALEQADIIRTFSDNPHVVAFVPAEGPGSGGPSDDLREVDGKPLFLHVLDTLLSCHAIDDVYLDTGSDEVARAATDRTCKRIHRPGDWATGVADTGELLLFEASRVPGADIYIQARPSAPFPRPRAIDDAVFALAQCPRRTSTADAIEAMTIETTTLSVIRKQKVLTH